MTYIEREAIFAKDIWDWKDVQSLTGLAKPSCYKFMRDIKARSDRLVAVNDGRTIDGRLHVQDYLDVCKLTGKRYEKPIEDEE